MAKEKEKKEPGPYDGLMVFKGGKLIHSGPPPKKTKKKTKKAKE